MDLFWFPHNLAFDVGPSFSSFLQTRTWLLKSLSFLHTPETDQSLPSKMSRGSKISDNGIMRDFQHGPHYQRCRQSSKVFLIVKKLLVYWWLLGNYCRITKCRQVEWCCWRDIRHARVFIIVSIVFRFA